VSVDFGNPVVRGTRGKPCWRRMCCRKSGRRGSHRSCEREFKARSAIPKSSRLESIMWNMSNRENGRQCFAPKWVSLGSRGAVRPPVRNLRQNIRRRLVTYRRFTRPERQCPTPRRGLI